MIYNPVANFETNPWNWLMDFVNHYLMIKEDLHTYKMGYKAFRKFEINYFLCL